MSMDIPFLDRKVPCVPEAEVRETISRLYGIDAELQPLSSERDQNFRLDGADGKQHIVKISNALEEVGVIEFQTSALLHLEQRNPLLPIPRVARSSEGRSFEVVTFADGSQHIVHLLGYLPGSPLSGAPASAPLRRRVGQLVADIDIAFQGFFHPNADYYHPWNLSVCDRFIPYAKHIADPLKDNRTLQKLK